MDDDEQKETLKKSFALIIRDCPASLRILAKFYRVFGFSFFAAQFEETDIRNDTRKKLSNIAKCQKSQRKTAAIIESRLTKSGITFLVIHIYCIVLHLSQYFVGFLDYDGSSLSDTNQTITDDARLTISERLSRNMATQIDIYRNGFNEFKPILRFILFAILNVVTSEILYNFIANMWHGGRFLRHLATISGAEKLDHHQRRRLSLGHRLIGAHFLITIAIYIVGLSTYDVRIMRDEWQNRLQVATIAAFNFYEFLALSFPVIFFAYAMIEYRHAIEYIGEELLSNNENNNNNNQHKRLFEVRDRLAKLSAHFCVTIESYFQLPLTIASITNVYMIIAGCCFLILIDKSKRAIMFCAFMFNFAAFSFVRMCAICVVANFATNAADQLIVDLYRRQSASSAWTVRRWICFNEIKRLRHRFRPTLFGTSALRQSSAVGFLGFALGYIVVLLQTETFTSN